MRFVKKYQYEYQCYRTPLNPVTIKKDIDILIKKGYFLPVSWTSADDDAKWEYLCVIVNDGITDRREINAAKEPYFLRFKSVKTVKSVYQIPQYRGNVI